MFFFEIQDVMFILFYSIRFDPLSFEFVDKFAMEHCRVLFSIFDFFLIFFRDEIIFMLKIALKITRNIQN